MVEFTSQPKGVFALVGATLHPVSGPPIPNGTLIVADGKIAAVGPAGTRVPPEAQTIELGGLDIWPGLIDAGSTIGLSEIDSLPVTQDFADASRFEPELRASTALRPDSEHIPVTRANGVLTAYVQPTGGLISGQGCVINLRGWVPRELVVVDPAALDVTIPTFVPRTPEGPRRGPVQVQALDREALRVVRTRRLDGKSSSSQSASTFAGRCATARSWPRPGPRVWLPRPLTRASALLSPMRRARSQWSSWPTIAPRFSTPWRSPRN